jgi:hypothetical protein
MSLPACPFCDDPVVGLAGQDVSLDTFLLRSTDEDRAVLESGFFGPAHFRCLVETALGSFWARRTVENMSSVRGFAVVADERPYTLLHNEGLAETIAVRDDGWRVHVEDSAISGLTAGDDGAYLPVAHELNLSLSDFTPLAEAISGSLRSGGSYSLAQVIDALGVMRRLLHPNAVHGGRLSAMRGIPPGGQMQQPAERRHITALAEYRKFLPAQLVNLLHGSRSHDGAGPANNPSSEE